MSCGVNYAVVVGAAVVTSAAAVVAAAVEAPTVAAAVVAPAAAVVAPTAAVVAPAAAVVAPAAAVVAPAAAVVAPAAAVEAPTSAVVTPAAAVVAPAAAEVVAPAAAAVALASAGLVRVRSTAARPATVLHLTVEVMSLKPVQAVNFFFLVTKARLAFPLRKTNCLLTPEAPFRTNFWPSVQPEMSAKLKEQRRRLEDFKLNGTLWQMELLEVLFYKKHEFCGIA